MDKRRSASCSTAIESVAVGDIRTAFHAARSQGVFYSKPPSGAERKEAEQPPGKARGLPLVEESKRRPGAKAGTQRAKKKEPRGRGLSGAEQKRACKGRAAGVTGGDSFAPGSEERAGGRE